MQIALPDSAQVWPGTLPSLQCREESKNAPAKSFQVLHYTSQHTQPWLLLIQSIPHHLLLWLTKLMMYTK